MKKFIVLSLVMMIGSFAIAQKKELKAAEKAIKSSNFTDAKSALVAVEGMLNSLDDKSKAKYYFLKGKALYAGGAGSDADINDALKNFKMLRETEKASGKVTYTGEVNNMMVSMSNEFLDKAQNALNAKNHSVSSANFERAYRTSSADTLYLYNAAILAASSKEYDRALDLYSELSELGYTGIATEYVATNVETGTEEKFPDEFMRDISVKAKTHEKPRAITSESKVGEIAKNVSLIYIEKGDTEKALSAIEDAKKLYPNDFNLIISEANVRYKLGDVESYRRLVKEALELDPDNADLLFNLGVTASDAGDIDEAKKYYEMALEVDPNYTKVYMNLAAMVLGQEQALIDEMNSLGTSSADNKRYDELQDERTQLYKEAVPYLTTALEQKPDDVSAAKTLMNIYSILGETDKFQAMKDKVAELQGN